MAHEILDLIDRDRVTDSRVNAAAFLERDAAVDADQFAFHIEERPAAVAGVDGGIGLDEFGHFAAYTRPFQRAAQCAHNSRRNRPVEAVRVADSNHQLPHFQRGASEFGDGQPVRADPQHCNIDVRFATNKASIKGAAIG